MLFKYQPGAACWDKMVPNSLNPHAPVAQEIADQC